MKGRPMSIGKLSMGVLIACTGLAGANLLTNGDFETQGAGGTDDAAGWFRTNTSIVGRYNETGQAGHGDWELLLQDNADAWHWASQIVPATAGVEYTASIQMKGVLQAGEIGYVYIDFQDSGGASLGAQWSEYVSSDADYADFAWVTRTKVATAPAGTAQIEFRAMTKLDGQGNSGVWMDNAELVPEPATMGLFGLMGGAMLWARRRFRV